MKRLKSLLENKKFLILLLCFSVTQIALAQSGAGSAQQAIEQITSVSRSLKNSVFEAVTIIAYIIVAVFAIANASKVYAKIQSGDGDSSKLLTSYFGGIIFFVVVITLVRMIFIDN